MSVSDSMLLRPFVIHTCYAAHCSEYNVVAMELSTFLGYSEEFAAELWRRQSFNASCF
jgi:hypothetical protein